MSQTSQSFTILLSDHVAIQIVVSYIDVRETQLVADPNGFSLVESAS